MLGHQQVLACKLFNGPSLIWLWEPRAHSCTTIDCTAQSLMPCLGPQHRHWIVDDWKHVAWSDESHFQWSRADGCVRVWIQPHETMDPTCQQGTVQSGGVSVMVWAVCRWLDMRPLICLETTLAGDR
ncbi:hypothetical protein AVEN_179798-1 [Araneus ventricosus]|uniref:Transposable element Tc1 transposase n=1 Tax=Araneus ventricosus TaxID=182803 RepID=A0A4Y2G5A0_ARAVE|nr:hypothetical protein AVEN_179798-1 [Araneus ventricosus]